MNKGPKRQQKVGTNQDTDLTNSEESLIENTSNDAVPSANDRNEGTENTSLTQLPKDDGEITRDFTDGDDPDYENL